MKIIVAGGSGLVGSRLVPELVSKGHEVLILTTGNASKISGCQAIKWNPMNGELPVQPFKDTQAIINLAGANVGQKWSAAYKEKILLSRTTSTCLLAEMCTQNPGIHHFINASATGIYRESFEPMDETGEKDQAFLGDVVQQWEDACPMSTETLAVSRLRIGLVLARDGGLYSRMKLPYSLGIGSPLGNGRQWMSWIHMDDLVAMILHVLENKLEGPYNAVSPEPIQNREFSKVFAKSLNRPHFMPAIFGEFSQELVKSYRLTSEKICKTGFTFAHDDLLKALESMRS
jgi:uncharacterized protein (TIGR01777 family)